MKHIFYLILFGLFSTQVFSQPNLKAEKHNIGFSHSFIDFNVRILDGELSSFDSSLSHIVRLSYHRELSRFWAFSVGLNNGFMSNFSLKNQFQERVYALGLDYQIMLKLNNGKILKESARIAPYLTFGNKLDALFLRNDQSTEWWMMNQYGLGLNIRIVEGLRFQAQTTIDQMLSNDFNTSFQHRLGFLVGLGKRKSIDPPKDFSDRDGDGIMDSEDLCADIYGLKKFRGCPDSVTVIQYTDLLRLEKELDSLKLELLLVNYENKNDVIEDKPTKKNETKVVKVRDDTEIKDKKIVEDDGLLLVNQYYFVITISVQDKKVANNWLDKLKINFPDSRIIPLSNGFYRVGVYAGRDKSVAITILNSVKEQGYNPAWISVENFQE